MTDTLLARHSLADRVAYGSAGERAAADLLRDAAAVAHALPERRADKPLALLGVRRDLYACVAALLGAWERGYEVLVPPADATREGFLHMAQRPDVGAVLHDTASSAALPIARILESAAPERGLADARCTQHGVLHLAAAEASGAAPALRLSGAQLLQEAALLGRSLDLPERADYACSLLPSTRYAWAAGVFWPLLCGGAVLRDDPRDPTWAEQCARAVLVAAPAQLRLLLRDARAALAPGQRVLALGAPLPAAAFQRLQAAGLLVSDVYATQQLGCLGQRGAQAQAFRPLLGVSLQAQRADALQLAGPHFADRPDAHIHATSSADGGFIATGVDVERAEREERIAWLEGVHDAALLALNPPGERRWQLALSLEPSAPDDAALAAQVSAELPALEISEWRSLQRQDVLASAASFASGRCDLNRNGAGRHDRASVLRLFGRAADMTPLSWELVVERDEIGTGRAWRHVHIPERYGYFTGHFPGYPLLPGAAQLSELVVPFVRVVRPELGRLTRMARLKFQERIVPNDRIEVSLVFGSAPAGQEPSECSVEFALRRGDSVCANGRLWFELPSPRSAS